MCKEDDELLRRRTGSSQAHSQPNLSAAMSVISQRMNDAAMSESSSMLLRHPLPIDSRQRDNNGSRIHPNSVHAPRFRPAAKQSLENIAAKRNAIETVESRNIGTGMEPAKHK